MLQNKEMHFHAIYLKETHISDSVYPMGVK